MFALLLQVQTQRQLLRFLNCTLIRFSKTVFGFYPHARQRNVEHDPPRNKKSFHANMNPETTSNPYPLLARHPNHSQVCIGLQR